MRIYRCKKCGWVTRASQQGDIGRAHAHAEKHAPGTLLGKKLPTTYWPTADPEILGKYIEELHVKVETIMRETVKSNWGEGDTDQ